MNTFRQDAAWDPDDGALKALLPYWRAPEPSGAFESAVMRRIRLAEGARTPLTIPLYGAWGLRMRSALADGLMAGITVMCMVAVGLWFGSAAGRTAGRYRMAGHPIAGEQTLTGAYLEALVGGRSG